MFRNRSCTMFRAGLLLPCLLLGGCFGRGLYAGGTYSATTLARYDGSKACTCPPPNPFAKGYVQNTNPFADGYVQTTNPFADDYVQDTNPFGKGYVQDTNPFGDGYIQDKCHIGLGD